MEFRITRRIDSNGVLLETESSVCGETVETGVAVVRGNGGGLCGGGLAGNVGTGGKCERLERRLRCPEDERKACERSI